MSKRDTETIVLGSYLDVRSLDYNFLEIQSVILKVEFIFTFERTRLLFQF